MTRPGDGPCRVLVHSDRPQHFVPGIRKRFPQVSVSVCETYAGIAQAIERERPEIVLSHKFENAAYPGLAVSGAPGIRWIHCGGTGVDHFAPWDGERVTITNSPGVASVAMSEYALAAIYALNLYFPHYARLQHERRWLRGTVRQTQGGTAVVIGLGRIGRRIAARLKGAGLTVIGIRSRAEPVPEADRTLPISRLKEALAEADHIVVIVPLTAATRGLIDRAALDAVRPGAFLVNLSRGGVVDETALLDALRDGRIGGAALDVFENEPLPPDSPFWDLANVIVTPHSAGFVEGWESIVCEMFCDNLGRWLDGKSLCNVVASESGTSRPPG
jgi:phosphoglycerate dehydrogenase-like enzyme